MQLLEGIKIPSSTTLAVSAGVVGGVVGGLIMKKVIKASGSVDELPQKWVKVGEVKDLVIYPMKGLPGLSLTEAELGSMGLKGMNPFTKSENHNLINHFKIMIIAAFKNQGMGSPLLRDRVFLIANEQGKVFSQGKFPMLALTRVRVEGNKLHLSHVNDPTMNLTVDVPATGGDASLTKVAT